MSHNRKRKDALISRREWELSSALPQASTRPKPINTLRMKGQAAERRVSPIAFPPASSPNPYMHITLCMIFFPRNSAAAPVTVLRNCFSFCIPQAATAVLYRHSKDTPQRTERGCVCERGGRCRCASQVFVAWQYTYGALALVSKLGSA